MEEIVNRAISAAGGLYKLAALLGVSPQAVVNWRSRGIPIGKCAAVETFTRGAVTRAEMRPADYWLIWPDLKAPKKSKRQPAAAEA